MTDPLEARLPVGFRTMPQSIDAEQALLGAILVNNEAFHRVADFLKAEHFSEPAHSKIFAAMGMMINGGGLADHVTLGIAFDQYEPLAELDGALYLSKLQRAAETVLNAEDYGRHIHDLALRRGLIRVAEDATNSAYDMSECVAPAITMIEETQGHLDKLAMEQPQESWRSIGEITAEMVEDLRNPHEIFSTGLPALDGSMAGGLHRGAVYGFEARMKQGKTLTMGTIALALMKQSTPFLYLALEMGDKRILERQIASETNCNSIRFRQRENPEDLIGKIQTFGDQYGARRGYYANEPGLSFDRLRRLAHSAVIKLGIKVLFVDYWQLLTGKGKGENGAEFSASTAQWLAAFGAKHGVAVVLASQENRTGESYGGDGLAKACDWLAVLHKIEWDERHIGPIEALWMDIKWNRDGPDGSLGGEDHPAFRIDKIGPVLRGLGDWG